VYRVDRHGRASVLLRDPALAGAPGVGWGLNGIAWAGSGVLIGSLSAAGALVRVPVAAPLQFTLITLDAPIGSPDGLAVTGRGSLALVDNSVTGRGSLALVDNSAANRIVTLLSRDGWRTGRVTSSIPWPGHVPTTLARTRCGRYALDGRLDVLLGGGSSDEFVIQRFPPPS
jgi:hypothetical protein